jgi:hypothetical protein
MTSDSTAGSPAGKNKPAGKKVGRSRSSGRWLKEHFDDPYVKEAQKQGYRSRASFKLLEIQEKDRLIRPGMTVVDLGAAPRRLVAGGGAAGGTSRSRDCQ